MLIVMALVSILTWISSVYGLVLFVSRMLKNNDVYAYQVLWATLGLLWILHKMGWIALV